MKNEITNGINPDLYGTIDLPIFEAPESNRYDFIMKGQLCICLLNKGQRIQLDYINGKIIYLKKIVSATDL